jgi:hypothetical protein
MVTTKAGASIMEERPNLMLQFFADGSGKSDQQYHYLTFSGLMAKDEVWEAFQGRWRGVLDKYDVPYSHRKDLLKDNRPFHGHGWDDRNKLDFFLALCRLCLHDALESPRLPARRL